MIIGVAGPYTAPSEEQRQSNLDAMNEAAARLLEMGHIPLIGINAAIPVLEKAKVADAYKSTMDISMALIGVCQAILVLGESEGVEMEKQFIISKGLPVYYGLNEIPVPE